MEKDGIGTGFWLERVGEVEIRFYPDDDIALTPSNEVLVFKHMREATVRLIKAIKAQQEEE